MRDRILITGGCGFLGKALRQILLDGSPAAEISILDREPRPRGLSARLRHFQADLTDARSVSQAVSRVRPGRVFHLAGADKTRPWPQLWNVNVLGTFHLMEALRALPGRRRPMVVVAGTCHEAGWTGSAPLTERVLERPANPYACSKLLATHTALPYARFGVPVVVARMTNILGPGLPDHNAPAEFCRQIAAIEASGAGSGRLTVRGDLDASRDFVDVEDVARGLILLSIKGAPGEIYNVSSGRAVRVRTVLSKLLALARVPIRVVEPKTASRPPAPPMRVSSAKLRAATRWRPRVTLRRSLSRMLGAWRDGPGGRRPIG